MPHAVAGLLALLLLFAPQTAHPQGLSLQDGRDVLAGEEAKEALIAFTNFVIGPGIPGTQLAVNRGGGREDERIQILRGSIQPELDWPGAGPDSHWKLRLDGGLGFVQASMPLDISDGSGPVRFDTERQLFSGRLGAGAGYELAPDFQFRPMLAFALSRVESTSDTEGTLPFPPIGQDPLVDWSVNVASVFASLELDYDRLWHDRRWEVTATYSHGYHDSYDASNGALQFNGNTDTLGLLVRRTAYAGIDVFRTPLDWDVFASHTNFLGLDKSVLGFNNFFTLGLGLNLRIQQRPFGVFNLRSVGLNTSLVFGQDITGGTIGISFRN